MFAFLKSEDVMDLRSCQTSWLKVSQVVEPVQSSSLAGYAGYLHDGLSHRQGLCPSPLVHSFLSSTSVSGGAAEVDEEEHCEVQSALLLHVHEDRQLSSEEEVSGSAGDFLLSSLILISIK